MAQIQEYLPQVDQQGPTGGTSPNLELGGAVGRGIENLGGGLSDIGTLVHRRQAQEETANVYADFADRRLQFTQQIDQQTRNGTLDVDKIAEQYDNETSTAADELQTSEGRNYFTRQQARVKGAILKQAISGASQLAANATMGSWTTAINKNSSALMETPLQYEDVHDQAVETVDQMVKTGAIPEKFRDKTMQEVGLEYSKGAIRGWANLDPDKAKQMLDEGGFDQYMNSDQKQHMYGEINTYAHAKTAEANRTDQAIRDAQQAKYDAWGAQALPKLTNGSLSTKDVLDQVNSGTMDWEQGNKWIHMIDEGAKQDQKTNPRLKNLLIDRIRDPDAPNAITDRDGLMPFVGKGISISDFNQLNSLIDKTPEGEAAKQGQKALFDTAKKTVRFKNMMTGQYDLQGEQKLAQFMGDYVQAKKSVKASGGNPADLLNPSSPLYFGSDMNMMKYQTSMADQLTHQSQDRTDKALNLKSDEHQNNPGTPVKGARKPNESPADYLKRVNLGG